MTWDEWFNALKAFIADRKVAAQWARQSGDVVHTLERIAREIREWKVQHPPPPHPRRPPVPRPAAAKKVGEGMVDIAALQRDQRVYGQVGHTGNYIKAARLSRKTEQGGSTLLMLVALGGVPLAAIGAAVVKFAIESIAWDAGEKLLFSASDAIYQALTPATQYEAESQYQAYLWNIRATRARFGPNILQILPRDEWIWQEYGVRWDALR